VIFVDTGAWFAALVPTDADHADAVSFLRHNTAPLLTSDYVLDELLTLLKMRGEYTRALRIGAELLSGAVARLEWVSHADVLAAWITFQKFHDKGWSFTDCVCPAIIDRLEIRSALAFDEHFRQFGTITVLP
jgi:predicted nucleic acid-binding protein